MHARVEEIIRLIVLDLPNENTGLIPAGIVLTGGCANIPGIVDLTERITRVPVRLGVPISLNGIAIDSLENPAYATSVGLVLWSMKNKGTSSWFNKPKGFRGFVSHMFQAFR